MSAAVGIIGVGAMGLAAAERLIAAGFAVVGYRRSAMTAFVAAGGVALESAEAVVAASDPVILLLRDDAALGEVMQRIAPGLRRGQIVLCLGTHPVPAKEAARALGALHGASVLDGEVSGTPGMLRAGLASVLVAGDEAACERVAPVLAGFARAVTNCGAFGNAARMKLVTNYLVGVHTLAAADALRMAGMLGLEPAAVVAALAPSAAGSTMLALRGRMMAEGAYEPGSMEGFVRFFDLLRSAGAVGSPLLDLTETVYRRAVVEGYGERDIATIYEAMIPGREPPTGAGLPVPRPTSDTGPR